MSEKPKQNEINQHLQAVGLKKKNNVDNGQGLNASTKPAAEEESSWAAYIAVTIAALLSILLILAIAIPAVAAALTVAAPFIGMALGAMVVFSGLYYGIKALFKGGEQAPQASNQALTSPADQKSVLQETNINPENERVLAIRVALSKESNSSKFNSSELFSFPEGTEFYQDKKDPDVIVATNGVTRLSDRAFVDKFRVVKGIDEFLRVIPVVGFGSQIIEIGKNEIEAARSTASVASTPTVVQTSEVSNQTQGLVEQNTKAASSDKMMHERLGVHGEVDVSKLDEKPPKAEVQLSELPVPKSSSVRVSSTVTEAEAQQAKAKEDVNAVSKTDALVVPTNES